MIRPPAWLTRRPVCSRRNRRGAHDAAVLCVYRGGEPPGGAAFPANARRLTRGRSRVSPERLRPARASIPDRTPHICPTLPWSLMPAAWLLIITFSIAFIRVTRITLPVSGAVNSFDGFSQYYRESARYTEEALNIQRKRSVYRTSARYANVLAPGRTKLTSLAASPKLISSWKGRRDLNSGSD